MTATIYPTHRAAANDPRHVAHADYAARRAVAAVLVVLVVAALAVAGSAFVDAVAGVGGQPASATADAPASAVLPAVHVAQPGDTLWSIAEQYRGDVGQGRFVDTLVDLNGGATIQIGQAVRLP